jgi:hypothetical protein
LNSLSKEVFGKTSTWQKVLKGQRVEKTNIISGKEFKGFEVEYPTIEKIKEVLEERVNAIKAKKEAASAKSNATSTQDGSNNESGSNPAQESGNGSSES